MNPLKGFWTAVGPTAVSDVLARPLVMDQFKGFWSTHGTFHPKGFIVAVFDRPKYCEDALRALNGEGWQTCDLRRFYARDILEHSHAFLYRRNSLQTFIGSIPSEEKRVFEQYLAAAEAGKDFLFVYAEERSKRDAAKYLLFLNQAKLVRYYGAWTICELTP